MSLLFQSRGVGFGRVCDDGWRLRRNGRGHRRLLRLIERRRLNWHA